MKKPKTIKRLSSYILIILGAYFILDGLFLNPEIYMFIPLGIVILALGSIIFLRDQQSEKRKNLLLSGETCLKAKVSHIKQKPFTSWGEKHPYVVTFTYEFEGASYQGKSHLLWEKPQLKTGDILKVYIEKKKPQFCAVNI